mgnify:CR=1 FL=1
MFAKLTGTVDDISAPHIVLDVQGVGYLVAVSARTRGRLEPGGPARLFIETQVREDAINLYGFYDAEEQAWFRLLTSVQGVGAKVGLSILSTCTPADIALALAAQDKGVLTRADGVGPKLATRIVTELKDKVPDYMMGPGLPTAPKTGSPGKASGGTRAPITGGTHAADSGPPMGMDTDTISALVNLGYGRAEAFSAVMRVKTTHAPETVGEMIKLSLNELTGRSAA